MTACSRSDSTAPASSSYEKSWWSDALSLAPMAVATGTFGSTLSCGYDYCSTGEIPSALSILGRVGAATVLGMAVGATVLGYERRIENLEEQIAAGKSSMGSEESGTAASKGDEGDSKVVDTVMTEENNYGLWKSSS